MGARAAYAAVILIWSTTPLAVKWSGEDIGFLTGAGARMLLALVLCLALLALLRRPLPWDRAARRVYGSALLSAYGAMVGVYWASSLIPSGLLAVLFGLTPVITAVLARLWLGEDALGPGRSVALVLGVTGLVMIFGDALTMGTDRALGAAIALAAVTLHATSTVLVKRAGREGPDGLATTTGTLVLAVPLYALTWALAGGGPPAEIPPRAAAAIAYLGVIGSVVGFSLYYHVLRRFTATGVGLIPLVTPVLALLLGALVDQETLTPRTWSGVLHILLGLVWFQWGDRLGRANGSRGAGADRRADPGCGGATCRRH